MSEKRASFSNFGAIMALAGSAVGLGNIWKFPYMAGANGGAAFILLYVLMVVAIGIPVMLAEFIIGRKAGKGSFGAFKMLAPNRFWRNFGFFSIFAAILILSFYSTVGGWTLQYIWVYCKALFADIHLNDYNQFFSWFTAHPWLPVLYQGLFIAVSAWIVVAGVEKGIERFSKWMMPVLFILLIVVAVRSITLPAQTGSPMEGIRFLFNPDFSKLTPRSWLDALGQAFFSLSLGMGVLLTYGSYIKKEDSLTPIALKVVFTDTFVAILAGVAIFPAVFTFGVEPTAGPGLVFLTLPKIFNSFPAGDLFALLFFVLIAIAAVTSAISLIEVITAHLIEDWGFKRKTAVWSTSAVSFAMGVLATLSSGVLKDVKIFGLTFFDLFDFVASNVLLPIGGILISIFVGWVLERHVVRNELSRDGKSHVRLFKLFIFVLRYVAPIAILLVFLGSIGLI